MSNTSYSTLYQRHSKGIEGRQKTLIITATAENIPIYESKNHNEDEIDNMEEVKLVEGETQTEKQLLNHYRLSTLPNYDLEINCKEINEENNKVNFNQQQLPQLLVKEAIHIENTFVDLYNVPSNLNELQKDVLENKKENLVEDNIQGSSGLALLASCDSVTPRSSLKTNTSRLNTKKTLTNQTKFIVPTYVGEEIKDIIETTKNNCQLQDGIELPKKSFTKSLSNTQFVSKVPTSNDFLNNSDKQNSTLETLNNVPFDSIIDTTISLTSEKVTIQKETVEKDMKLKHKTFDYPSYIDEDNSMKYIPPKASYKNFKLNSHNDKETKEDLEFRFLKNENNRLVLKSNNRECIPIQLLLFFELI